jgi:hypothetical protein
MSLMTLPREATSRQAPSCAHFSQVEDGAAFDAHLRLAVNVFQVGTVVRRRAAAIRAELAGPAAAGRGLGLLLGPPAR